MSDDSSDDGSAYSTTNTLLGYASKEFTGDEISFLGGTPIWLARVRPSYDLFQCKVCRNPLSQLLQLNGELPEQFPTLDRRLHILACRKKACSRKPGSIRVLRATRQSSAAPVFKNHQQQQYAAPVKPKANLGNDIFGVRMTSPAGANPFSKAAPSIAAIPQDFTPAAASQVTYSIAAQTNHHDQASKPSQPWPAEPTESNSYPKLYLDADYESLEEAKKSEPSSINQVFAMEDENGDKNLTTSNAKEDAVAFESDLDRTFQRFADRLAHNPEQVLRYEFNGDPLLYSATDEVGKIFHPSISAKLSTARRGLPACTNCSKPRTFELQLMPHAIIELEGDDLSLDGMEWGTVVLGVCEANCQARGVETNDVGYVEEWAGVQWEETKK